MIVSLFLRRSKVSEKVFPMIFHRAHLVREGKLGGQKKIFSRSELIVRNPSNRNLKHMENPMLVLPIVLTERLGLSAELAAIQLKQELSSAVPDWAQKAVNNVGAQVFATICIQDGGEVTGLKVSLQAPNTASVGSINFTCSVLIETFTRAQHRLKETVVEKWVSVAVEKRLKKGRELFDTSDQEIHQMISRLGYVTSSAHNQVEIQKYFFICLAKRWSCRAYVPVSQLIYAAFRSKAKGLLPPSDEWRRRGL